MIEQGLFKRHFVGRDGFQWWIGQIPPEESWKNNIAGNPREQSQGFGERYRVRILGYHTANADDIPDEELPWAYVMYPITAGGGGRGSSQSANITQGTFVFGFFIDGEDAQIPIIMGILGNNDYNAVMKNITPTRFIPFDGYPENDEVMGQERSTLQVNEGNATQVASQENATGQPVNDQYTSSAQGNTSTLIKSDEEQGDEPPDPLAQTSECEKSPMGDIQRILMNVMNEIHKFNQLLYDARGAISAGVADVQRYIENAINKVTGKVAGALKWVFTEIEKFILKQLNNLSKLSYSLVFPDQRETLNVGMGAANDAIVCVIRNLINELPRMVGDFISAAAGAIQDPNSGIPSPTKLVNVPLCFVENFAATTFGNLTNLLTGAINDALGAIDSITGGVTELIGSVVGFVEELISFLTCGGMAETECPKVNEWSIKSGPGAKSSSSISSLLGKVQDVGSSLQGVADSATGAVDTITSLGDIDFSGVFATSGCDLGPRSCGSPVVEFIGDGQGAEINLVVSASGEILAGDVISAGIGFLEGSSYLKVYDDCGIGQGAVIKPVFGEVDPPPDIPVVDPGLDDNGFPLGTPGKVTLPDGSVVEAGIGTPKPKPPEPSEPSLPSQGVVDVIVVNPGYDYLPGPNGDQGGDGDVWAPADHTVILGESDGSTDYYPPIPPENTVGIPTGGTVTTPPNSNPTDIVDPDGNLIEVQPGVPTFAPDGGTITSPTISGPPGYEAMETNIGVYPPDDKQNIWKPVNVSGPLWDPNTAYKPGNIVTAGPRGGAYPSTDTYPVILYLCELIVNQSGMDYHPDDEVVIEPNMGATAVPKFDKFGRLLSIKVTAGGEGFTERPKVYIKTQTGFGAHIIPKFCIDRVGVNDLERDPELQDKVVTVVNCVGKF